MNSQQVMFMPAPTPMPRKYYMVLKVQLQNCPFMMELLQHYTQQIIQQYRVYSGEAAVQTAVIPG